MYLSRQPAVDQPPYRLRFDKKMDKIKREMCTFLDLGAAVDTDHATVFVSM